MTFWCSQNHTGWKSVFSVYYCSHDCNVLKSTVPPMLSLCPMMDIATLAAVFYQMLAYPKPVSEAHHQSCSPAVLSEQITQHHQSSRELTGNSLAWTCLWFWLWTPRLLLSQAPLKRHNTVHSSWTSKLIIYALSVKDPRVFFSTIVASYLTWQGKSCLCIVMSFNCYKNILSISNT